MAIAKLDPETMKIETAEEAIQAMGDSIAHIFDQLVKGHWTDDHGHAVVRNVAMINAKTTLAAVMVFRTREMGYTEASMSPGKGVQ